MIENFSALREFLKEELAIYQELLALSKRKEKTLLEKFSTDLTRIVTEEEKLIQRLSEIEENRRKCIEVITGDPNSSLEEVVTLIADTALKADLWMIGTNLKDTVNEIKEINQRNQRLLEQALELTQYTLKLLTSPPRQVTYGIGGKPANTSSTIPSLIDRKA